MFDTFKLSSSLLILILTASHAGGQQLERLEVLQGRPDQPQAETQDLLGPAFESQAAGIVFRPPAGSKQIRQVVPDEIVQFVNDERNWVLKASRSTLQQPLPLRDYRGEHGEQRAGLLELTARQLKAAFPGAEVLRQDIINIAEADVGMIAIRYTLHAQRRLTQQALIQANDQLYYVLTFTTPTGRQRLDRDAEIDVEADVEDPQERVAVEVFRHVLDSLRLLDRGAVREDQDQRLFRTRALFVSWTPDQLKEVMVPEQWLRLIHDGKDIGYTYIVEELDLVQEEGRGRPLHEGLRIGIRSRTQPEEGVQVDAESWLFCSLDRRHENWSSVVFIDAGEEEKEEYTEFGASARLVSRVLDDSLQRGDRFDPNQPPVRHTETYTLNVTWSTQRATGEPITRELPPFYIPQAVSQLLPRLLPLHDPKGYLFAVYVGEHRQVMLRYVDVEHERDVTLAGRRVRAIPIKDRIGLEGSVTMHYMSPDGRYLGSVNEDSKVTILPTDARTLEQIWSNPELTRPAEVEKPVE